MSAINLEHKYQLKSEYNHILDNPDTYIGSIEIVDAPMWIYKDIIVNNTNASEICTEETKEQINPTTTTPTTTGIIKEETITYIPALLKLFDEGIVNCRDHVVRMQQAQNANATSNVKLVTNIDISINQETGTITMINDGNGIDVAEHPEHKIWIPELIFGHLRTSTNYDKEEKKLTGGKNGFGFKLVLIWSTRGYIETVDHTRELKYCQEFNKNLTEKSAPKITKCKLKPYTKICFTPDYARLGISGLTNDMIALLKKRVYDICAITDKKVKVKYNSVPLTIKNFTQYVNLYIGDNKRIQEENGERWEYIASISPSHEFTQISFVNGIHTSKGGKHVDYILNQIINKLKDFIEKKKKTVVNSASIKEQLILFIRCDIENPSFDSQSKDYMNTPASKFGSSCVVSDKFIEKLAMMGVMDSACAITDIKKTKEVSKKTDGSKTRIIHGIPKLIDANWAGTEKSVLCTLILTEGDSAKSSAKSGLSSEDRNIYGIYPLKGKVMNVRDSPIEKIAENVEITEIKKIIGLEDGREYTKDNIKKYLRYGKIMIMTDSDVDGSHIKGLIINLIGVKWLSLFMMEGFISFMNTPIIKAKKGKNELCFYNNGEYELWKNANNIHNWDIKYYKGLATSTSAEFKEYFKNKKVVEFVYRGKECEDIIDMAFNKKRTQERKLWLENYDKTSYLDTSNPKVFYNDFINKELIHFSHYDCDRSIPNLIDGLKVSQRKILYSVIKKNITKSLKVAQLSGYVSEHSCYHHGEKSIEDAIINMAQNYVGSNNINLLYPIGAFGTRYGDDSGQSRYIYTKLTDITNYIFPEIDNNVLNYLLDDDGEKMIEPEFYAPIIPMLLINGTNGIGTGFSTDVMCYNPLQIIRYLKKLLLKEEIEEADIDFIPYYEEFKGTITRISPTQFLIKGCYEKIGEDKIRVTELPIGLKTEAFDKKICELLLPVSSTPTTSSANEKSTKMTDKKPKKQVGGILKDKIDMSKDNIIDYTLVFNKGKLEELENNVDKEGYTELEKILKLYTTNKTTNMHAFNHENKLVKYETVKDIIDNYYPIRYKVYVDRKEYQIKNYEEEISKLSNKHRFITENLEGTIDLRRKKLAEVNEMLLLKDYPLIDGTFKYLTKLTLDILTEENVESIKNDLEKKINELEELKETTIEQLWINDLIKFESEYYEYIQDRKNYNSVKQDDNTETAIISKTKKSSSKSRVSKK